MLTLEQWWEKSEALNFPADDTVRKALAATSRASSAEGRSDRREQWKTIRKVQWHWEMARNHVLDGRCRAHVRETHSKTSRIAVLGFWEDLYMSTPDRSATFFRELGVPLPEWNALESASPGREWFSAFADMASAAENPRTWMSALGGVLGTATALGGAAMRRAVHQGASAIGLAKTLPWSGDALEEAVGLMRTWVSDGVSAGGVCSPEWLSEMALKGSIREAAFALSRAGHADLAEIVEWPENRADPR